MKCLKARPILFAVIGILSLSTASAQSPLFHYGKKSMPISKTIDIDPDPNNRAASPVISADNFLLELPKDSVIKYGETSRRIPKNNRTYLFSKTNSVFKVNISDISTDFTITILHARIRQYGADLTKQIRLIDAVNAHDPFTAADSTGAQKINDSITTLRAQIADLQTQVIVRQTSDLVEQNKTYFLPTSPKYVIDTLNKYLYNQNRVDAFQTFSGQFGKNTFINPEFASFLFGRMRLGLSGIFQATGDTSKDNVTKASIQKVLAGGGSLALNLSTPLLFCTSQTQQSHFGIFLQSTFGFSPASGDSTVAATFYNNISFMNQSGLSFIFDFASNDIARNARISLEVPCYYVWGSQNFYHQVALPDFSIVQLKVGLVINNLLSFQLYGPLLSTSRSVQSSPYSLSIQFSPSQVLKSTTN